MGVFNTLIIECPKCQCECAEQVKPGYMMYYSFEEANNADVKENFVGEIFSCFKCGCKFTVERVSEPTYRKKIFEAPIV